jgi:hypothetical protein
MARKRYKTLVGRASFFDERGRGCGPLTHRGSRRIAQQLFSAVVVPDSHSRALPRRGSARPRAAARETVSRRGGL